MIAYFRSGVLSLMDSISCLIFFKFYSSSLYSTESTRCWAIFASKRPAATPMFIAVSTLSPVSTQTLIPTFFMNYIVKATSSCSLSSIAVEPMISNSFSISLSTWAIFPSLFSNSVFAFAFFYCHFAYSASSKRF